MESHWTSRHVFCIDNVAIVLPTKISQFKLACLMEGHWSSSFSLWLSTDQEAYLIEWYQVRRYTCYYFTWPASMRCHQAITSDTLTITYANYVVMKQHTCMPVAKTQGMQACVFVTSHQHPTNRNAGYSSVHVLVPDQQPSPRPSHYFHWSVDIFTIKHVWL